MHCSRISCLPASYCVFTLLSVVILSFSQTIAETETPSEINLRGIRSKAVKNLSGQSEDARFFMLGIAIDKYNNLAALQTPVKDVEAVINVLMERYHFEAEHIRKCYNEQATRTGILSSLVNLKKELTDNDFLLIYYAGHGEKIDGVGYWIPVDGGESDTTGWVLNERIKSLIGSMPARHVLLISDSCFSGDFLGRGADAGKPKMPEDVRTAFHRRSRCALTSGGDEPVKDRSPNSDHSIFASFLLKALKDNKRPFITPSNKDFFDYIDDGLLMNPMNRVQRPQYGHIKDTESTRGGEFVFFLREGLYDPALIPPPLPPDETEEPEEAKPPNTNSIMFSNPANGLLKIKGKKYFLSDCPVIHLELGDHAFSLELSDGHRIYGVLKVHVVDSETEMAEFGLGDGIFLMDKHIKGALEGRPVSYSVSITGAKGVREVVSYKLSRHKF